ncbi:DUF2752 domain-containing protein [Cyanobium sp. T1B-Tous]|nr:DUF2752 domain-containing protein [Cyanobium sp. T1B-Tous]
MSRTGARLAAGLLLGAGGAVAGASWQGLPLGLWRCPLRQLTGIPCPTCFLTRSVLATLRGDWAQAVTWHALGPLLVALGLGLGVWTLLGGRWPTRLVRRGSGVVALLGLAYWLWRLWGWGHGAPLPA